MASYLTGATMSAPLPDAVEAPALPDRTHALLRVATAIASAPDLATMLATLADELGAIIPHDELVLFRLRPHGAEARLAPGLARKGGAELAMGDWTMATDQGLVGAAFTGGEALLVNDAHLDPRSHYAPGYATPYRAAGEHALVAPLVVAGRPIGVLYVNRIGGRPFVEAELARFRLLAEQAAVAIRNAMLREDAELARAAQARQAANLEAVLAVSRSIASAADLPTMLGVLADAVEPLIPHRELALYRLVGDGRLAPALYRVDGVDASDPAWSLAVGQGVIGSAFARGEAELVNDAHLDPRSVYLDEEEHHRRAGEHTMQAPLVVAGRPIGVLHLSRDGGCPFTDEEFATFRALAEQAAVATHNAGLLDEARGARERAARHAADLEAVLAVTRAITSAGDLDRMLEVLAAELATLVPYDVVTVFRLAPTEAVLEPLFYRDPGLPGIDFDPARWRIPVGAGVIGSDFLAGQAERIEHIERDPRVRFPFEPGYIQERGEHAVVVPFVLGDRPAGVLFLARIGGAPFTEDEFALCRVLAEQAAVAVLSAALVRDLRAAENRAIRRAAELETVLAVTRAVAAAPDLAAKLDVLARELTALVPHDGLYVYRLLADGESLQPLFLRDRRAERAALGVDAWRMRVGEGLVGHAAASGLAELIADAHRDPRGWYPADGAGWRGRPTHAMTAPLLVDGRVTGVLYLDRAERDPFSDEEFTLLRLLAEHAAVALHNAALASQNRDLYLGGVRALASAVDQKDQHTRGHSERVSAYARGIADALGLPKDEAERVELAGLLHDIGKIGVPDRILQKPGKLSPAERAVMMEHSALGARMLADAGAAPLQPLVPLVRHHHEHLDGRGYPDGLAGDAIPLGAAIIAVADAFDTMVTDRPYRVRCTVPEALAELRRYAGSQFHPEVVAALAELIAADSRLPIRLELAGHAQPGAPQPIAPGAAAAPDDDEPAGRARAGLMGDPRPLQLLIELAGMTRHMPDLEAYLARVVAALQELDYEDVMLFLVEPDGSGLRLAAHAGALRRVPVGTRQPFGLGTAGAVAVRGRLLNVGDVPALPSHAAQWPAARGSELAVPLVVETATIGVLSVASATESAFSKSDETVLTLIAEQVAVAVHVAQLHADARRAATTDGLTELLNHRAFYEELERAAAAGEPFSVVLFDVEGLKAANDSAGHLAGDALLRRVADTIRDAVRAGDAVARYGGDEFAAILRGADLAAATAVAARVREHLLADAEDGGPLRTTVRYGAAVLPDDGTTPYELVGVADARLYEMRARLAAR